MRIYDDVLGTVGNTPLVRLNRLTKGSKGLCCVKYEAFNPGGSIKDRIAITMVDAAEKSGLLKPGGTIVENTSGNTGLGLAITAAVRGYNAVFTMPDKVAPEKSALLRSFGATVKICPTAVEPDHPDSYYSVAKRLSEEIAGAFYPNQYYNDANPIAHYQATGPEIWNDTDGKVTHYVAGMGTGGTISGTAKYLKEHNPDVQVIGIDPIGSIYKEFHETGKIGEARTYKIEGVGEDIMPSTIDFKYIDDVISVTDTDAFTMARRLAREEGIFTGSSGGMCMHGALEVASRLGPDDLMVVLIPDTGERYLSKVYNEEWLRENQLLEPGVALTAREICQRKKAPFHEIFAIDASAPAREAISMMRERDVSQLPVMSDGKVVGSLREARAIEVLLKGDADSQTAGDVMEAPFPVVEESTPADQIFTHLSKGAAAVLVPSEADGFRLITKWDLIRSISE